MSLLLAPGFLLPDVRVHIHLVLLTCGDTSDQNGSEGRVTACGDWSSVLCNAWCAKGLNWSGLVMTVEQGHGKNYAGDSHGEALALWLNAERAVRAPIVMKSVPFYHESVRQVSQGRRGDTCGFNLQSGPVLHMMSGCRPNARPLVVHFDCIGYMRLYVRCSALRMPPAAVELCPNASMALH